MSQRPLLFIIIPIRFGLSRGRTEPLQRGALSFRASPQTGVGIRPFKKEKRIAASLCAAKQVPLGYSSQ